jgi:hypothetical protein
MCRSNGANGVMGVALTAATGWITYNITKAPKTDSVAIKDCIVMIRTSGNGMCVKS